MDVPLRRTRGAVARRARTVLSPAGVRGLALETAWTAAHLATYPLGFARDRLRDDLGPASLDRLSPVQRGLVLGDVEAAGTPIVLLHGWVDNRSIFTLLRRQLRRRGFGRVVTMNYAVTHDVPKAAARLAKLVEQVCADTGYERVHVVGHSMGGLVARYYVQRLGGDARVHTLATLGTPHHGTRAAHLFVGRALSQLRPGSAVIRELAEPAPGCRTRFVAVWSDLDHVVVPNESARVEHPDLAARNVFLRGVGHLSLPIDGRVVREIVDAFAHLDSDGSTLVAPLAAPKRRPRNDPAPAVSRLGKGG
ncbi:MAG TPA: alpha/beta fold hydrolase [Mycobacteriales bacterium]|nr:alpha/beta fold hydrolase [Mycobacteriales bacterium]